MSIVCVSDRVLETRILLNLTLCQPSFGLLVWASISCAYSFSVSVCLCV